MAKHEFGMMQTPPEKGKRYDEYEPEKYNCIVVDDILVEEFDRKLLSVDFYWHTLDIPAKGLAYTGITLIPPTSLQSFLDVIREVPDLEKLKRLLEKARSENKWIIHFGL